MATATQLREIELLQTDLGWSSGRLQEVLTLWFGASDPRQLDEEQAETCVERLCDLLRGGDVEIPPARRPERRATRMQLARLDHLMMQAGWSRRDLAQTAQQWFGRGDLVSLTSREANVLTDMLERLIQELAAG